MDCVSQPARFLQYRPKTARPRYLRRHTARWGTMLRRRPRLHFYPRRRAHTPSSRQWRCCYYRGATAKTAGVPGAAPTRRAALTGPRHRARWSLVTGAGSAANSCASWLTVAGAAWPLRCNHVQPAARSGWLRRCWGMLSVAKQHTNALGYTCWRYWVKVVTYAAVIFLCRKRCAVGKSMIMKNLQPQTGPGQNIFFFHFFFVLVIILFIIFFFIYIFIHFFLSFYFSFFYHFIFHFFIILFFIFHHFSSIPPLEAKMIKKKKW